MRGDINAIKRFLDVCSIFPFLESKRVRPWIDEIDSAINKELDFRNEIVNLKKFSEMYKYDDTVIVPRVYPKLSTDNVIVMDYVPKDASAKFNSTKVINTFIEQILFEGVIHGDLHGGNVGFRRDGNLILYDFGNTIYITKQYQKAMRNFIMALQMKNVDETIEAMKQMGMDVRDPSFNYNDIFMTNMELLFLENFSAT